ncbi:hypothetical protein [Chitinophaga sp. GbtcB8]|uniref:hypothetical protein n=1 Tax=Chitinophaga sp. GbtcB8 TaxID=2824753 RepID=UPI001C30A53A|nr:hypothetical protein [Chitinophaga sp. GbtcB8]
MTTITILPLQGIDIPGVGAINLGQSRSAIEKILGKPGNHSDDSRSFYDDYECRIDFDKSGMVEFIEFIYGPVPEKTQLSLYGIDPFRVGADNLLALLSEKNQGPVDDSEAEYCYGFVNISVGVWREFTEKEVQESIAEMKESGEYEDNRELLDEDLEKARNFWTIGIGTPGYYTIS